MRGSRNILSALDASEGALYILFYGILALSFKSPGLFAVDNFDQALNPRMASHSTSTFCTWILSKASPQVLLAAHNPAVLDGLDRRRAYTIKTRNNCVRMPAMPARPTTARCCPPRCAITWKASGSSAARMSFASWARRSRW